MIRPIAQRPQRTETRREPQPIRAAQGALSTMEPSSTQFRGRMLLVSLPWLLFLVLWQSRSNVITIGLDSTNATSFGTY